MWNIAIKVQESGHRGGVRDGHTGQQDRIDRMDTDPVKVELSSLTEMQKEFNGARIVFSVNVVGIIGHPSANKIFSKPHALCKDQLK